MEIVTNILIGIGIVTLFIVAIGWVTANDPDVVRRKKLQDKRKDLK